MQEINAKLDYSVEIKKDRGNKRSIQETECPIFPILIINQFADNNI